MKKPIDTFWIDLNVHHDSYSPNDITEGLGIAPWFAVAKGETVGPVVRKSTVWMAHFREGLGDDAFAQALRELLFLVESSADYLHRLHLSGGSIELIVNQSVGIQDGLLFKMQLDESFLKSCAEKSLSLRVQAWSASEIDAA